MPVGRLEERAGRLSGVIQVLVRAHPSPSKKKVTLYLDEDVLRAARRDRRDSEIVEDALRAYLGFEVEAMKLAVSEIHAMRDEKHAARGS